MSYHGEKLVYQGKEYTLSELAHIFHIHHETLQRRLNKGMSLEDALALPPGQKVTVGEEHIGKQIPIVFHNPVPSVFQQMQPVLGKQYIATAHGHSTSPDSKCKVFYTITLENGKVLITYPGEFSIQPDK